MNSYKKNQKIWLKEFIPKRVLSSENNGKNYDLKIIEDDVYLTLFYDFDVCNKYGVVGTRRLNLLLPRYIKRNKETFKKTTYFQENKI